MPRVNVFGKLIAYDVGASVINEKRTPPSEVREGSDLSEFTKAQVKEFLREETRDNVSQVDEMFEPDPLALATNPIDISFVKKGKDGNDLLRNVTPTKESEENEIQKRYVSAVLTQNRFKSTQKRTGTEQFRMNPDHPDITKGSWKEFRDATTGKDFSDGDLAHVGSLLTLRATRELGARDAYGRDGPDGTGASLSAILPGGAQSGLLKVDVDDISAVDVLESIIAADVDPANLDATKALSRHRVLAIGTDSFGQMNNVLEPFSGLLPLGMIGLSTALVLVLKAALRAVLAVFLLISSASKSGSKRTDAIGRHFLGNYNMSEGFESGGFPPLPLPASLFGLRETVHSFGDCVNAGIDAFFGGGVGDSFRRILETPGFYAVFCRSIVVSATTITDSIKDVAKGNPVQIAQNVVALVEVIRSSKIVAAMNMFAALGDSSLTLAESPDVPDDRFRKVVSTIDSLPDEGSSGFKSRLNGQLRLAWGTSQTPSTFLLPKSMIGALSVFSQLADRNSNQAFPVVVQNDVPSLIESSGDENGRLDQQWVEQVETKLDAEYMPFYFHDLRTNEIVSFPAFLTNISDNFAVNWETLDAYGRVDPVKIYKSTHRKVSVAFVIASTNPDDFDQMWVKINKLLTLVYPQWSDGMTLKNEDQGVMFTQPFSQVPTASPIVRIRLGDLFRSNYSKFALARLFGVGQNDKFKLDDVGKFDIDDATLQKFDSFFRDYFDVSRPLKVGAQFVYDALPGHYDEAESAGGGILAAAASAFGGSSKPKQRFEPSVPVPCKVIEVIDENTYQIKFVHGVDFTVIDDMPAFVAKRSQLAYNERSLKSLIESSGGNLVNISPTDLATLGNFFSAKDNAIVRSFESVGGKGMACAIDSMDFTWLDNIPWETDTYGSRAPKVCKVSVALTPIHDIAPGIDSQGFNRAPVYNVGRPMNAIGGDSWDDAGKGRSKFFSRVDRIRRKS